jgi:hypothetical protein
MTVEYIRKRIDALSALTSIECPACEGCPGRKEGLAELVDASTPAAVAPPFGCAFPTNCQRVLIEVHEEIIVSPDEARAP